ncbi:MAG TPA: SusE domain-containing protein [Chitinophaga sp.]
MLTILFNRQSLLALGLAAALFAGCKKDAGQVATPGARPVLTVSNTQELVLSDAYPDSVIEKISWTPTSFGYKAVITYVLEFDKKGNGFASPQTVNVSGTSATMTVQALNSVAAGLGLTFGATNDMVMRVRAYVGTTTLLDDASSFSDSITLQVNPYKVLPKYPMVYVPGSYTSAYGLPTWDPPTAPSLAAPGSDEKYQGYLYFIDNAEFKVNVARNWDEANYGGDNSSLSTSGPNLKLTTAGLYYITADMNALSWTHTAVSSFSLYGAATGNADKDLTATDAIQSTWSGTFSLDAGTFNIRVNHANTLSYGDTGADDILDPATASNGISITEAGTYKITLDLTNPGNYLYTIEKQ